MGSYEPAGHQAAGQGRVTLPLFPRPRARPRPQTAGAALHVTVGRRTAWLAGPRVQRLLDDVGEHRRQFDHRRRRWAIPRVALDDILAYAEHQQRRNITLEEDPR